VADPETGRSRQVWRSGFGTKREAKRALHEIIGQVDAGTYVKPVKQTLHQFVTKDWPWPRQRGYYRRPVSACLEGLDQQAADRVANYILGDQ
jgi:hypothetical protein